MKNWTHWLLRLQVLWLVLALVAILGFRASLWPWRPAILSFALCAGGLVLTGFFSLLVLFVLLRANRRGGGKKAAFAVVLSLPALIGALLLGIQGAKVPPIHDISTDLLAPPAFLAARALRQPGDNSPDYPGQAVADQQKKAYPDIVAIEVPMKPAEAYAASLAAAGRLGWRLVAQNPDQGLIEAIDRSLVFGFTDDIVIRISAAGNSSRIDLRSASRAGVSDLGVNAKRIRAFRQTFKGLQPN